MCKYLIIFFILFINLAFGCTDFVLINKNNDVVVGRSMEFGTDLKSEITLFPKGKEMRSILPNKQVGLSWKGKYNYLGITTFGINLIADGMNEKGLSIGALWFPTVEYPKPPISHWENAIKLEDLGSWILSSFSSLSEVAEALKHVKVWAHPLPQFKSTPPIHLSLHDRTGKSMVIEFLNGKMEIINNPIGVLTNTPKFEWQETNLSNYINLSALNKAPMKINSTVIDPTGQGTGLLGIPGDWTPPSRFVKIAILKEFVKPTTSAKENRNLALHLLNTVDIPYGVVRSSDGKDFDYTQWIVVKDLTYSIFSYRTYNDLGVKTIDLKDAFEKIGTKETKIPMIGAEK